MAFFVPIWQTGDDRRTLNEVRDLLASDGYPDATVFDDSLYGTSADLPGLANLDNFRSLKDYDVVVIATHGSPNGIAVEYYCTQAAAETRMNTLAAGGMPADWMRIAPVESYNTDCPTQYPTPGPSSGADAWTSGAMWGLGFSTAAIAQFFAGARTSLLFLDACSALPVVQGLGIAATYAYPVTSQSGNRGLFGSCGPDCSACSGKGTALNDISVLFRSLVGEDGVEHSNTQQAYDLHKDQWSAQLAYVPGKGAAPIVLAPAVITTDPPEGGTLTPGQPNFVTVTFDSAMANDQPATLEGNDCGAKITDHSWKGDSNVLWLTLDVPVSAKPATTRLRIHTDQAVSAMPGWSNHLSGNEGTKQFNGEDPNDNDYVWHMRCGSGLDLKVDGEVGGKPVSGQIIGQPNPVLTCDPLTSGNDVVGSVVRWSGQAATSKTDLGGEWSQRYGTWPVGDAVGAAPVTIDIGNPLAHLGGISGSVTISAGGGSIDATVGSGADSIHVTGTWTCPS